MYEGRSGIDSTVTGMIVRLCGIRYLSTGSSTGFNALSPFQNTIFQLTKLYVPVFAKKKGSKTSNMMARRASSTKNSVSIVVLMAGRTNLAAASRYIGFYNVLFISRWSRAAEFRDCVVFRGGPHADDQR